MFFLQWKLRIHSQSHTVRMAISRPLLLLRPPLSQGYLNPAPGGIDAVYAWTYPGGGEAGVKLVDVEAGWHLDHEDLPSPNEYFFGNGLNLGDESHGTAVLGVIAARDNGFGATGIVPDASIGWSSSTSPALQISSISWHAELIRQRPPLHSVTFS